jgi:8-oxo-dGTP pyrophosphatase MutT (NUDIX family)
LRGRNPWELLLMHRPWGSDFAPGAYVFPGGTVHADDAIWEDEIRAAAIREVFEEIGILLARRGRTFATKIALRSGLASRAELHSARPCASSAWSRPSTAS